VTVPIHQHDVSRTHDGLHRYLIRGGSAVRSEEELLATKSPGPFFLGDLDIARWFEQRIQTAGCGGGFSQENVGSVKMTENRESNVS